MKKTVFIVMALFCLIVSCENNRTQQGTEGVDTTATDEFVDTVEIEDVDEDEMMLPQEATSGITLSFSSYHLYTCEDDKYDASGYQAVSAKVTIDEEANVASVELYDSGTKRWYPFSFRIYDKMLIQDGVITYLVYNNVNQKGYIYISTNRPNGLFVDINNFNFGGDAVCCWMQQNDNGGHQQGTTKMQMDTETPPSKPSFNPHLYGGSLHYDEEIVGDYYNYEETVDCVEGVVVYEGTGDVFIVETRRGYTVLERYSGAALYEGQKLRGELNRYGFKYVINRNRDSEVRVYIEDYALTQDGALDWMGNHKHLKYNDQEAFDANN